MTGNNNHALPEIPESWEWTTLTKISKDIARYPTFYGMEHFTEGIPVIRGEHINSDGTISHDWENYWFVSDVLSKDFPRTITEHHDIIMSVRGSVGKLGLIDDPLIGAQVSPNCIRISLFKREVSPKFVLYFLKSLLGQSLIRGNVSATTIQTIKASLLKKTPIPFPPLPEQNRIVARIEELFTQLEAGVSELQNAKAQLKHYRAAVLKSAVEGELTREWRETHQSEIEPAAKLLARILSERREKWEADGEKGKYKEPVAPNTEDLPELQEGWVWATLEQLCPRFVDSAHRTPHYGEIGYPALGPRDVVGGKLNIENARLVNDDEFNIQTARHVPEKGDIVYSRELSFGWAVEIPDNVKLCLSQGICLFTTHPEINSRYFITLLNGDFGRRQAEKAATGSAHPHINLGDIKAYVFPVPPFAEQKVIATKIERRLSVADEVEKALDGALVRAERLRGSVLKSAFEGRL